MLCVRRHLRRLLPVLVLVGFSLWTVRQILPRLDSVLPLRPTALATVPLFNSWTIWWNADRVTHGFADYWNAPIFHPTMATFAFSEPQPATIVAAPVVWLTKSPAAAYNVYLILALCLNGVVTYRILRQGGIGRTLALLGGVMMIWLPISMRRIDVLQLMPLWPMLWTWHAIRCHGRNPNWKSAVELGLAYVVCVYTCIHHALFLSIVLLGTIWVLLPKFRTQKFWTSSTLAIIPVMICIGLVVLPMRQVLSKESFKRSDKTVTRLSATADDLFRTPQDSLLFSSGSNGYALSPGWIKLSLAVLGLALGIARRRHQRWALFLFFSVVLAATLATGPNLKLGDWSPWWTLTDWIPGLAQVRSAFRFSYLMQMSIVLLSVIGLSELRLRLLLWSKRTRLATSLTVILGILAVVEVPAPALILVEVPDLNEQTGWTEFVKSETPRGKCIACLPCADSSRAASFEVTVRWMYMATRHGVPMVNGYSGFFPSHYTRLRIQITQNGLTQEALSQLAKLRTHLIVVEHEFDVPGSLTEPGDRFQLQLLLQDPSGIDVYELISGQR